MAWYTKLNPFSKTVIKEIGSDNTFNYNPSIFTQGNNGTENFINTYGQVGWVFACVSRISSAIAETKWRLYTKGDENKRTEITDHPVLELFDFVNKFHTGLEMMEQTQTFIDLTGEAFWLVIKDKLGQPAEIWVMNPNKVSVVPDRKLYIKGYIYKNGNEEIPLSTEDIVHIKLPNPKNPFRGQSPLGAVSSDIEAEKYSSQYNRTFFQNSAEPSGVIQFEGTLTDSQYERLRYQWNNQYQGTSNAHKVAILEGGASWQGNMITQRDMQFRDLRVMNRDTIMGVYGMPKHILGIAEDVNRANAEASEYTFARWVLKPRLERIKAKLNEQFIPMYNDKNLVLDYDSPIPADKITNLSIADQGFKSGYVSRNEARMKVGLEPIADGDVFMEPLSSVANLMGQRQVKNLNVIQDKDETRWKAFIEHQNPLENEFIKTLQTYFKNQQEEVVARVLANTFKEEDIFEENNWNEKLFLLLQPLFKKAVLQGAEDTKKEIEDRVNNGTRSATKQPYVQSKLYSFDLDDDSADINAYVNDLGLKKSKNINKVTGKLIQKSLSNSKVEGIPVTDTAKKISNLTGFSKERAGKIARTETVGALNYGSLQSSKQSEIVKSKQWLAAIDEVTRDTHIEANGQVVPLDAEFRVGSDSMLTPCTGSDPAENVNCRCTILEVLDFDTADQIIEQDNNYRLSVDDNVIQKDTYSYPLSEARCPQCNKLLGKKILGTVNLFCNRCKVEIKFTNNKEKSTIIH